MAGKSEDGLILGIDPGLGTTGWGIVEWRSGRLFYVDSGRIRTTTAESLGRRLERLYRGIQEVIRKHRIVHCAVESGYVGRSAQSALQLGQARAAAILAAETLSIPVDALAPREIKMAVTGRGSAAKEQVSYVVGKMLALEFDAGEQDISDALAVALCAALRQRPTIARTAR